MSAPRSASLAVQRRLRVLDRGLDARLDADAQALHRTRVATRRVREALPLFDGTEGAGPVADLGRLVQDVTRALGGVREMDVAIELMGGFIDERPDLEPALSFVRSVMTSERGARLQRMRHEVDIRRLQHASRSAAQRIRKLSTGADPFEVLAARLAKRSKVLRRAVTDAGVLYAAERLHRVRIATKKLRYALELAHEMGEASSGRLATDLRKVQAGLGLLHDLQMVAQHARQALQAPHVPDAPACLAESTLSLLEEKIHAEHANYLADRKKLSRIAARTDALVRRLHRAQAAGGRAGPAFTSLKHPR